MAIVHNPDGSITVGILPESKPEPKPAPAKEKPVKGKAKPSGAKG